MGDQDSRQSGLLAWAPLLFLAGSAAYLSARWDDLPQRWIVHWDATGTPNGWMTRSIPGVFGMLVLGLFIWVTLEVIASVLLSRGAPELLPVREANVKLLRLVSASVSLLFGVLSVTLPLGPHVGPEVIVPGALVLVGIPVVAGTVGMRRALREVRAQGHGGAVEGYHGLHYSNANDPRLWVPKLGGGGYTVNFSHPWAWPVMALLVGLPMMLTVAVMVLAARH
jgi:uncharacterized membrane protein